MKLNTLIAKPQLVKCVLDDEDTIKEFGEPIEWWVWDRQPLETFFKFAGAEGTNSDVIMNIMRDMILDESGKPLLVDGQTLPSKVLVRVMTKMTELLGK